MNDVKLTIKQAKLIVSICLRYGVDRGLDTEERVACISLAKKIIEGLENEVIELNDRMGDE